MHGEGAAYIFGVRWPNRAIASRVLGDRTSPYVPSASRLHLRACGILKGNAVDVADRHT